MTDKQKHMIDKLKKIKDIKKRSIEVNKIAIIYHYIDPSFNAYDFCHQCNVSFIR